MTSQFSPYDLVATTYDPIPEILMDAMRCWRRARDNAQVVQPCLWQTLSEHDCELMAPALESLCLFYEAALGRPIQVGAAWDLSDDESRLICLVAKNNQQGSLECPVPEARLLELALCSVRAMLTQH